MQSYEKIFNIIDVISETNKDECSLSHIAKVSNMPSSTVHRILNTLIKRRYVNKDSKTGNYHLGSRLIQLGLQARDSLDLIERALPIMKELCEITNETSYLTVRSGNYGIYIEKIESKQNLRLFEPLGATIPLHLGASRKVILSYYEDDLLEDMYVKGLLVSREKKLIDIDKLKKELRVIRNQGYAISFGENSEGASGIAAPIFDLNNNVIASLSVAGPIIRFTEEFIEKTKDIVVESAYKLSVNLGWSDHSSF